MDDSPNYLYEQQRLEPSTATVFVSFAVLTRGDNSRKVRESDLVTNLIKLGYSEKEAAEGVAHALECNVLARDENGMIEVPPKQNRS